MWMRTSDFADNWPKYEAVIKKAATAVEGKISRIEGQVSEIGPAPTPGVTRVTTADSGWVHTMILRSIGSLYALILEVTFVPFLVFFMLAGKREVWHGTLPLFPASRRTQVQETLDDMREVLRDYLAGMIVLTLLVVAMSSVFFWALGLEYPVLTGAVSGILNMVPYIGAGLAWLAAVVVGLGELPTLGTVGVVCGGL